MLHFRASAVPKELFNATLKCVLPCSRQKSCFPAALHARAVRPRPRVLHAAAYRAGPGAAPLRFYCVKTEGAVELDEHLKKDGDGSEAVSDK